VSRHFSENTSKTGVLGVPPLSLSGVPLVLPPCFCWYVDSLHGSVSLHSPSICCCLLNPLPETWG